MIQNAAGQQQQQQKKVLKDMNYHLYTYLRMAVGKDWARTLEWRTVFLDTK